MLVTLTVVVRAITTLLTTRGPPQPPHQATPTKSGPPHQRARRPRPVRADEDPAAVMVRRPAPGGVVEPRPAESRIPDPVPGRVGRPARRHAGRHPDAAVALDAPPAPVLVERLRTVDARR